MRWTRGAVDVSVVGGGYVPMDTKEEMPMTWGSKSSIDGSLILRYHTTIVVANLRMTPHVSVCI
jgi:hypothetical protein